MDHPGLPTTTACKGSRIAGHAYSNAVRSTDTSSREDHPDIGAHFCKGEEPLAISVEISDANYDGR